MAKEFAIQRRVEFAETDMAGIMHFSNFFRYMETAEHSFYRFLGIPIHPQKAGNAIGWPRVHAECDYKHPLRFEDLVEIRLAVIQVKEKSIHYEFNFLRIQEQDSTEVAQGKFVVVCVEFDEKQQRFTPKSIPAVIRTKLQ